ncbi:MAG: preprotein translocase subunit SecA [Thermodesulfobacteriota bacterium]
MANFNIATHPATFDLRPERPDEVNSTLDSLVHAGHGRIKKAVSGHRRLRSVVARIKRRGKRYRSMGDRSLREEVDRLREKMTADGLCTSHVIDSFSLIREFSTRILGMKHHPSQLSGALIMLQGKVAEMETGEGKTLTATLPAATAALAGTPVHVISVNDYLTSRDAENMGPLYRALGLRVGFVAHGMSPQEKRNQYLCDITYVTNKELVFDYLRDRLTLGERSDPLQLQAEYLYARQHRSRDLLLRGLHYGIVDEADSILIDEARTPLIISGSHGGDDEKQFLSEALALAGKLKVDDDYVLNQAKRSLVLTETGRKEIESAATQLGPLWNGLVRRESTINRALTALHYYHPDEQYLVRDGKIEIIDEFTGRVMADRSWEQGLHQLIELKEGCELTQKRETLAKISYQRFFRRYIHLAGMTGTAREVAAELWSTYNLVTVKVPTHRPLIRNQLPDRIFSDRNQKWQAVVKRIRELHDQGRPVLVGTRSVAASEELSEMVSRSGLEHQVLNARQDAEEARIISRAGEAGAVTIATNMAGRGTDIVLSDEVRALGGLHVIATERHEAARIDRQLAGRCGRQGDPGSHEAMLSLDDYLLEGRQDELATRMVRQVAEKFPALGDFITRWLMSRTQKSVEQYHARVRKELFRQSQNQGSLLSFSGRLE